jgi:SAM-dependent methyltransferase
MTIGASNDESMGTARGYFDEMYADDLDPWCFDTSWYEKRKYAISLSLLPNARYRRCVEPGCANGALTEQLVQRCDEVIAYDFIESKVEAARKRLHSDRYNVRVTCARYPSYWPGGTGDLVVWSEIAYYLNDAGADLALEGLRRWLEPGGHLLAVHFLGATDYPRSGFEVDAWLNDVPWLQRTVTHTEAAFAAGVWTRIADEC